MAKSSIPSVPNSPPNADESEFAALPHRIELRGPWDVTPPAGVVLDRRRVTMPQSWQALFGPVDGMAVFERTFHRPTGLEPGDTVWLVLEGVRGHGQVLLREHRPGTLEESQLAYRFDITPWLETSNRLRIELEFAGSRCAEPGGLSGSVALEIVTASERDMLEH